MCKGKGILFGIMSSCFVFPVRRLTRTRRTAFRNRLCCDSLARASSSSRTTCSVSPSTTTPDVQSPRLAHSAQLPRLSISISSSSGYSPISWSSDRLPLCQNSASAWLPNSCIHPLIGWFINAVHNSQFSLTVFTFPILSSILFIYILHSLSKILHTS